MGDPRPINPGLGRATFGRVAGPLTMTRAPAGEPRHAGYSPTSLKIVHILRAPLGGLFRHVMDVANGQIERGHRIGLIVDFDHRRGARRRYSCRARAAACPRR